MVFILGVVVVLAIRPKIFITENGEWKKFGIGNDKSCICLTTFVVVWAILSFLLVNMSATAFGSRRRQRGGGGPPRDIYRDPQFMNLLMD